MLKCAKDLQTLFESDLGQFDVALSVSDFDDAMRNKNNPLSQNLPIKSKNIFIDIVRYAMEHNKELLQTIMRHTANYNTEFDEKMVIHIAKMYIQMGSKYNRNNNIFKKLQGVFLQSCGLTDIGLEALGKLGESETPRILLNIRTGLAILDEEEIRVIAKNSSIVMVIDNLDRTVRKVLQHKTLPILLCRDIREDLLDLSHQEKSLNESMEQFSTEFLLMDSPANREEKDSLLEVGIILIFLALKNYLIKLYYDLKLYSIKRKCMNKYLADC